MKTIYLMRHAKSSWKDVSRADIDRPLNKRGEHDAPFMGKLMHQKGFCPQEIISSPAKELYLPQISSAIEIEFPHQKVESRQ